MTASAAYTRINMLRPGESTSACGAYFRTGTPSLATPGSPYTVTLAAMDRYGNVRTVVDSVQIERVSGPTAMAAPARNVTVTRCLPARGRR